MFRHAICGLCLVGCTGPGDKPGDDASTAPTSETGQIGDLTPAGLFRQIPTVEMNGYFAAPLIGSLRVQTTRPATIRATISVDDKQVVRTSEAPATDHDLTLLGFRPDRTHQIEVVAIEGGAEVPWREPLTVTTDPLPPDFPSLSLVQTSDAREPGVDLFHVDASPDSVPEYIVALDADGMVVWYYAAEKNVNHVLQLSSGNLMYMPDRYWIEEIDLWGRTTRSFKSDIDPSPDPDDIRVPTMGFHHDVIELPNGNFLALGIDLEQRADYPASETVPGTTEPTWVAYDRVVEFQPDGAVVGQIRLQEVFDPLRVGYESVEGSWWTGFAGFEVKDWAHANSLTFDPDRSTLLVSLRHQDAVAQLTYPLGEIEWILAPPANWAPSFLPQLLSPADDQSRYPYHQHAAKWTPDGTLILFDNGNYQASAYEPPTPGSAIDSRAVEFRVDPVAGTFEQIWSWDALPEPNFSSGLGNVQVLPQTGHVLITYGAAGGDPAYDARVVEVDKATGAIVHDLAVDAGSGRIYRAVRLPSLYADGTPIH